MTTKPAVPATPLPWTYSHEPRSNLGRVHGAQDGVCATTRPRDAAYIVHACNAYPRLLAERAELAAALNKLTRACDGETLGTVRAPVWHIVCEASALLARLGDGS